MRLDRGSWVLWLARSGVGRDLRRRNVRRRLEWRRRRDLPRNGRPGSHGLLHGDVRQFVVQLGGASLCAAYAFGVTYGVFKVVDRLRPMRVEPEVEIEGLDLPEFGMLAYPEEEGLP